MQCHSFILVVAFGFACCTTDDAWQCSAYWDNTASSCPKLAAIIRKWRTEAAKPEPKKKANAKAKAKSKNPRDRGLTGELAPDRELIRIDLLGQLKSQRTVSNALVQDARDVLKGIEGVDDLRGLRTKLVNRIDCLETWCADGGNWGGRS